MITRTTWIVLGLFAISLAGLFFWQRSQKNLESQVTPTALTGELLFNVTGQINALRLEKVGGRTVEFSRNSNGEWNFTWPMDLKADSMQIDSAVSQLLGLTSLGELDPQPSSSAAGLDKPSYRLLISVDNGEQEIMNVGKITPTDSGYYVLVAGNPVAVVSKYSLESILKLTENLPILPTVTPEISLNETPLVEPGALPTP